MRIIGIESGMRGTDNQIIGLMLAASQRDKAFNPKDYLLKDSKGTILHRNNYKDEDTFHKAVSASLASFCQKCEEDGCSLPEFVILPYVHSSTGQEGGYVDLLSQSVKAFFIQKKHPVKTIVLASKVYPYKFIDIVNVGLHQMSKIEELRLKQFPELAENMVITEGVASNLSWKDIKKLSKSPAKAAEFAKYEGKKVALFSLGGKTSNGVIQFSLDDAKKIVKSAEKIQTRGYDIIFTNSPRTPNEVTDYLYEECKNKNWNFYNSKAITDNPQEAIDNFTIYNGKYNQEFMQQAERTNGNIYPAVLNLVENNGFVVNTWDSFSYTSDAAALGITSVVYDGNIIDDKQRPDCKKLFEHCLQHNYICRLDDEFIMLPEEQKKTTQMSPVNDVICKALKKNSKQSTQCQYKLNNTLREI